MKHGYKMADEKKVLLGIADTSLRNEEDLNAGWSTNKFGGVPVINFYWNIYRSAT